MTCAPNSSCSSLLVAALDELHQALAVPDWIMSAIAQQIVIHVRSFCEGLKRLAMGGTSDPERQSTPIPTGSRMLAVVAHCLHFRTGTNQLPRVWRRLEEFIEEEEALEVSDSANRWESYRDVNSFGGALC